MRDMKSALIGTSNLNKAASGDNRRFAANHEAWTSRIVDNYCKYSEDMNKQIAKLASENKLNDDMISRLVQESNTRVYLNKYASIKREDIRRVDFPIASLEKIKDIMKQPVTEKKASFYLDDEAGSIEKTASTQEEFRNFLNSSDSYDGGAYWSDEQMQASKTAILKKRVQEKLASDAEDQTVSAREFLYKVASIGDGVINYVKMGYTAQQVFEKLCSDARLDKVAQAPIREYIKNKADEMKYNHKLAKNANCDLAFVEKKASAHSLGKHSVMMKFAVDDLDLRLPDTLDSRGSIRSYEDLVNLSQEINDITHHFNE